MKSATPEAPFHQAAWGRGVIGGTVSIGWSTLLIHGLGMLRTALLARLLVPELFGVVALAELFIGIFRQIQDFQFDLSVISRPTRVEQTVAASLLVKTLFSVLTFAVVAFGFRQLDRWYDPRVGEILLWFAAGSIIQTAGSTPRALMERHFRFTEVVWIQVGSGIIRTIVPVAMAYAGWGLTSLVASSLLDMLVPAIGFWLRQPPKLGVWFSFEDIRWLFHFSVPLWVATGLSLVCYSTGHALLGKYSGTTAVGYYALAFTFARTPVQLITHAISRAAFPAYAKFQQNPQALSRLLRLAVELLCWCLIPVAVLAAALAPEAVRLVLGPSWIGAVGVFQSFCLFTVLRGLQDHAIDFFNSQGRTTWFRNLMAWEAVLLLAMGFWVAARFGAIGMAWAVNLMMLGGLPWVAHSLQESAKADFWSMARLPLVVGGVMAVMLFGLPWSKASSSVAVVFALKLVAALLTATTATRLLAAGQVVRLRDECRLLWKGQWAPV